MRRPPKQMRKASEAGPRGRRQSPKYQNQRCRPSKESQTRTRPSKSVQRVWHHSRHRRGGNRRAWAGRNSSSIPFSVYPLASGWSSGQSGGQTGPTGRSSPFYKRGAESTPLCLLHSCPATLTFFLSLTCHHLFFLRAFAPAVSSA